MLMNQNRRAIAALLLLNFLSFGALAFQLPDRAALADFDLRQNAAANPNSISAAHKLGVSRLTTRVADLQISLDPTLHRPGFVSRRNGFLTGTNSGVVISKAALGAVATNDPHRLVKAFLNEHAGVFGHDASALTNAVVKHDYVTKHNGLRTTIWEQQFAGIPVFEGTMQAHVTRSGELVNLSSRLIADPAKAAGPDQPTLTATQAIASAEQSLGATDLLAGGSEPKLIWLPMNESAMRLCWDVTLTVKSRGETFRLLVDALTGEVLIRRCLTTYLSNATYNVFTSDSPSPFTPGWPTPNTNQPPLVTRSLMAVSALNTNASPNGWINDGNNTTVGNNVDAHTDRNGDNLADPGSQPIGSPFRVFDYPLNLASPPTNSSAASVAQLFYWCNWMHDKLYELGFDEASGNFQTDNFGRGGAGGDALQADGQDAGVNNSNMTTPPDGSAPRMQMYLFNGPFTNRDADLEAEIILHEYTHGLSWRLVGGGVGIGSLQTGGMGEGWSDFYALALLSSATDDVNSTYPMSGYVSYLLRGLTQNYYFGIRRYPYSTDMMKNPLTLADITQSLTHTGIPRSPIFTTTAQLNPAEAHNQGEVWCSMLWEARALLIGKYGFTNGNQLILRLVTDGMKLSPAEPNYVQARDAILQADLVDNAGADRSELWQAFAKRGLGVSAYTPASSQTFGLIEAYDADVLDVLPRAAVGFSGPLAGPFRLGSQTYELTNSGATNLLWFIGSSQPWLNLSFTAGALGVGQKTNLVVSLNAAANALGVGSHNSSLAFSNATTGIVTLRTVTLDVLPGGRTHFFPLDTDPAWTRTGQWQFGKPAGSGGANGFHDPISGATGTNVFGVNTNGDYTAGAAGPFYLTAGPLNFTGCTNTSLGFSRWLNSDMQAFAYATIEVSSNGTTWTPVWSNAGLDVIAENSWGNHHYDISAVADNHATVYVRWGYQTKAGVFAYSGWNIDDVEFFAGTASLVPTNQVLACSPNPVAGTLAFSWPTLLAGFYLQQKTNLASPNWVNVTNAVAIVGTNYQVAYPTTTGDGYFRLIHP